MTQTATIINSGGYVQIRESIIKGSGPEGPDGPTGPRGAGLHILGELADEAALNAVSTVDLEEGDAYTLIDTGHLWTWFALTDIDPMAWHDAGRFKGDVGYLMSVMAKCELASTYGSGLFVTAGQTELPTLDIVHNDIEAIGEDDPGTKTTVLGLIVDGSNNVTTSSVDAEYIIHGWPVDMSDPNEIKTDPTSMNEGGTYLVTAKAQFTPSASGKGIFTLKLLRTDFANSFDIAVEALSTDDVDTQPETITLVALIRHIPGYAWSVSIDSTLSGTLTSLEFDTARLGGGYGPKGAEGDTGEAPKFIGPYATEALLLAITPVPGTLAIAEDTGDLWSAQTDTQGDAYWFNAGTVKGDPGNPSGGYASWDAIAGVTGSPGSEGTPPTAGHTLYESDQDLPYPNHTTEPYTPYHSKLLAETLPRRIVGRFDSRVDYDATRPTPESGEVYYLIDERQLFLDVSEAGLSVTNVQISPTIVDSGTPPGDGDLTEYPDGTIWVQVQP